MIVAAAVCPGPPFLVPGLAPRLAQAVPDLVAACQAAIAALAGAGRIVVVTTGARGVGPVARGPGWVVRSSSLGRSDLPPDRAAAALPAGPGAGTSERWAASSGGAAAVGTIVAAHLLQRASITVATSIVEVDPAGPPPAEQVRALFPGLDDHSPTGLLVIADGAACHGSDAPGADDPASAEFDASLCAALAAGDPAALAAFCSDRAQQATALRCESLPVLAVLAALADPAPVAGTVDYYATPFGVGYVVARWRWHSAD